jgi:hypothetical protein
LCDLRQHEARARVKRLEDTSFPRSETMNRIIWLVGAVVIVLFVAGYFGLR